MPENRWSHMEAVVDAFTAAGNATIAPGFRPTQGGWECLMTGPLDKDVAAAYVKADPRLTYQNDELSCCHCWAIIVGGDACARYTDAWAARHQPPAPGTPGSPQQPA
jgi:hypothetical protein